MSGCDVLFRRFFRPWYRLPPGHQPPSITKGDIEVHDGAGGRSVADLCQLRPEQRERLASQVTTMVKAAREDWATYLAFGNVVSLEAIHGFDEHWNRSRIAETIRTSDPADFSNDYLVLCCELGAVVGEVMRAIRPELEWLYDSPYWESSLWHSASGSRINVFHWAIKKMSAYGAEDGLRPKILAGLGTLGREA